MRKFIVSVVVALVVLCGASFYVYKSDKVSETYENNETKKVNNNNMLSMMLETSAGSGEYQQTTASAWPSDGYVFNSTLSKCKNGSNLNWDNDKKQVLFEGNTKDDCYFYFDKTVTLVDYVKAQYTGTQGGNNLYYHDSSLTNGAGDNSYRYAGSSETTNNFVCFGYDSTDGSCPTDNLYRIIGVFDNHVKLIKYDYAKKTLLGINGDYYGLYSSYGENLGENSTTEIGVYTWNKSTATNIWSESALNKINLNTNYLNNIGSAWSSKIAEHMWVVGGNTWVNLARSKISLVYENEILLPAETLNYDAKIGLLYLNEYGFAANRGAWTSTLSQYDYTITNWMYMGLYDWTISRWSDTTKIVLINYKGTVDDGSATTRSAIRPTFYLNSDVTYVSGNGTKNEPFIIN